VTQDPGEGKPAAAPSQLRTLWLHCLRFDLVEGGPDRGSSRLYSGVLPAVLLTTLFAAQLADAPARVAVPTLFLLTGFLAFFGILADVGGALLDPRDAAFLAALPVPGRRYLGARLGVLGISLLLKVASFGLVPAIVLSSGGRGPLWAAPVYLLALGLAFVALAGFSVVAFLLLRVLFDPARLRELLLWVQVALYVIGTAGWLLLFQAERSRHLGGGVELLDLVALPTNWFAALYLVVVEGDRSAAALLLPVAVLLAAVAGLIAWLGRGYLETLRGLASGVRVRSLRAGGRLRRAFERSFVAADERAGFLLGLALLRRERTFRLQTYPLMAYPLLFIAFGHGAENPVLFGVLFSHLATLYLPIIQVFLRYSDTPEAAWVLRLHRVHGQAGLWRGVHKALVFAVVLPLSGCVTALLVLAHGVFAGLANGAVAFALATWVATSGASRVGRLPFAERFTGAIESQREVSRVFPLMLLVVVLGIVQYSLWTRVPAVMPGIAVLALWLAFWWLRPRRPTAHDGGGEESRGEALARPRDEVEPAEPFPARLRRELRGLLALYAVLVIYAFLLTAAL
jgi:hypothetical protein